MSKHYLVDAVSTSVLLCRYRQVPLFRWDTICQFARNMSELKRMAARDFEDILQVSTTLVTRSVTMVFIAAITLVCHPRFHRSPTSAP